MRQRSSTVQAAFGFTILMALVLAASILLRAQFVVNIAAVAATLISAITLYFFFTAEPTEEKIEAAMLELGLALERNWGDRMTLLLGRDTEMPAASQPSPANLTFSRIADLELIDQQDDLATDGDWNTIYESFYRHISTGRLAIVGEPGYGKTLLAIQLVLQILHIRHREDSPDKRLPVPVSIAGWDGKEDLPTWLAKRLKEEWHLSPTIGRILIRRHLILPVLDGLDEVGSRQEEPEKIRRQLSVLRRLNSSGATRGTQLIPIIMTCRTTDYRPLRDKEGGLLSAAVVAVEPLNRELIIYYLSTRFDPTRTLPTSDGAQWLAFARKIQHDSEGNLEKCLKSPWYLSLAIAACRAGEMTVPQMERFQNTALLERFLTASSISAATRLHPRGVRTVDSITREDEREQTVKRAGGQYDPENVRRWLTTLADHLDWQARNKYSPTNIDLLTVWRLAEANDDHPRLIHTSIGVVGGVLAGLLGGEVADGITGVVIMSITIAGGIGFGLWAGLRQEPQPSHVALPQVNDLRGRLVIAITILAALLGGIGGYLIGGSVAIGVSEGVSAGFAALVLAGLGDRRVRALQPGDALRTDLSFGLALGIVYAAVGGLPGGLTGGILSHLHLNHYLTVPGSIALALVIGMVAGIALGARSWLRYAVSIGLEARRGRVPWRFERFMDWAYGAALLRLTGVSYQFRHDKLRASLRSGASAHNISEPKC